MAEKEVIEKLKKFRDWLWNSDSILSYAVFLVLVFILIKFIFFPLLGLAFNSALPLAIVESSSMDHSYLKSCLSYDLTKDACSEWSSDYEICGNKNGKRDYLNFDEYWSTCGSWYESNFNISKEKFENFGFKNGFAKGDILVIMNWRKPAVGDIILFKPNEGSAAQREIIHRVVEENPYQTKGDHNEKQLMTGNNLKQIDETAISEERLVGTAVAKIPYFGWAKLFFVELWKKIL